MDDLNKNSTLHQLWDNSMLAGGNAEYLEQLYEQFLRAPAQVPAAWRTYFEMMQGATGPDVPHTPIQELFRQRARHGLHQAVAEGGNASLEVRQTKVRQLVDAYRFLGHLHADLDPLKLRDKPRLPELGLEYYGLTTSDLDFSFTLDTLPENKAMTLNEIVALLQQTYCSTVAVEYMHISEVNERRWLQNRLESTRSHPQWPGIVKRRLVNRLMAAEGLERYLHTKYVGQKRFSLEGAESLVPLMDELIQRAGIHGIREVMIGMAHRGRLNVLINILGKTGQQLFLEFEGKVKANGDQSGDVKYHMGFSTNLQTPGGKVHVALAFNPSHLEIVGPVVEGSVRARQDRRQDRSGDAVIPVLIHGDAAFAGQGVVMETFNMSQSRGFSTKGTVHVVINNQIGFTTSNLRDARSSLYCTDIAKMVGVPVFHVNGDDPEAVLFVTQLALDYRMTFHKDVVIDLVCYRRHGHSEADEPVATQPVMYQHINALPTLFTSYARKQVEQGIINREELDTQLAEYRRQLEAGACVAPNIVADTEAEYAYLFDWTGYQSGDVMAPVASAVPVNRVGDLCRHLDVLPEGFAVHPKVEKILDNRRKMAAGALPVDWGFAEIMAYATLVTEGYSVRLSGQDSGRGTFFHRHAVLHNQKNDVTYVPLRNIAEGQQDFLVINSLLSEEAVLAFEYGYATTNPKALVIWEAQFGDFANNAQVVIDQFISAGEQKWNRLCSLVMFLPHGYEGQGPEHSSARLERYLQLCAQHNMQVCYPTTPAQIFHLLRRQMLSPTRKPLVVMTPKSLLRHREAVSTLDDLAQGEFQRIIPDHALSNRDKVRRVLLTTGKLYYDLAERRSQTGRDDVAILRIEQLYPFPREELEQLLLLYPNAQQFYWCQEEPKNQGAWFTSQHHVRRALGKGRGTLEYIGRDFSAAPAAGYMTVHLKQLHALIDQAFMD